MLTSPKVIVPDHIERTGAPASSIAAACAPPLRLRLGNFLLLHGGDARSQAVRQTRGRSFPLALDRLDLLAARLGLDQLAQPLAILVVPFRRIEIGFDGRDELLRQLQLGSCGSVRLGGLDAREAQYLVGAAQCR